MLVARQVARDTNALVLSYNNQTTTSPQISSISTPPVLLNASDTHLAVTQKVQGVIKKSISSWLKNFLHQERIHTDFFSHYKCISTLKVRILLSDNFDCIHASKALYHYVSAYMCSKMHCTTLGGWIKGTTLCYYNVNHKE